METHPTSSRAPANRRPIDLTADAPPHSEEGERALLGSYLLRPGLIDDPAAAIRPDDLYLLRHRQVYAAIRELHAAGVKPDAVTLAERLGDDGEAARLCLDLLQSTPHAESAPHYAAIVRDRAERRRLIEAAREAERLARDPQWTPPAAAEAESVEWGAPTPLRGLPGVLPFDPDLLPVAFRAFAIDAAERTQAPIDYIAAALMVALGSIVAGQVGIRPKRCDDWIETTNIWGAAIGRPGVLKTPAIQRATVFLRQLEAEAAAAHSTALAEWSVAESVRKAKVAATEAAMKKAASKGGDVDALARQLAEEQAGAGPPARRRYLTADATVEKLGAILAETGRNILTFRDELTGWLRSLDRPGQDAARAFYLEAWGGLGSFTFDRIGRGTVDIPRCSASVFGAIQPGPLASYLAEAIREGAGDDGLMQRFGLLVWPDVSKEWVNVDRWPDGDAKRAAEAVFARLKDLDADAAGTERDDHDPLPFLRFDPAAQVTFDDWRAGLEFRLRSGSLPAALESHLAKYRKLVPALALLDHLADAGGGPLGRTSVQRAIGWATYLESHATRVYGAAIQPERDSAKALLGKITAGELTDGFTLRDVYRPQWSGLSNREQAEPAVKLLCDLGWLREERVETGGRPSSRYRCHPSLPGAALSPTTDETDKSPLAAGPSIPSVSFVSPSVGGPGEKLASTSPRRKALRI